MSPCDRKAVSILEDHFGRLIKEDAIYGSEPLCKMITSEFGLTLIQKGKGFYQSKYWAAIKDGKEIFSLAGCSEDDGKTMTAVYAAANIIKPGWRG